MGTAKTNKLKILIIFGIFLSAQAPLAKEDTTPLKEVIGDSERSPSSYPQAESTKELSSSYLGFYNRHDAAGCLHAGTAAGSLQVSGASADQVRLVKARLHIARQYCIGDKTTRAQALKAVRESIKILLGHSMAGLD